MKPKILITLLAALVSYGIVTAVTSNSKNNQIKPEQKPVGIVFNNARAQDYEPPLLNDSVVQPAPLSINPEPPATPTPTPQPAVESAATPTQVAPRTPPKTTSPAPRQSAKTATPKPAVTSPCESGSFNTQFLCYINEYRKKNNKGALRYDSALSAVALKHSAWMQTTNTFSHTGVNGSKFYDRCKSANITCNAENLAMGFTSAKHLFNMWQASPGHNANMLGPYTVAGLGISGSYATLMLR